MNISEEQLNKARELFAKVSRVEFERELGLTRTTAHTLWHRIDMDHRLHRDPSILDKVTALLEAGEGRFAVSQALSCSLAGAEYIMGLAKAKIFDDDVAIEEDNVRDEIRRLRDRREQERQERYNYVKRLMDDGLGSPQIADAVGIPLASVESLMTEIRQNDFTSNRMMSKQEKFNTIDQLTDAGRSTFAVARALDVSPGTAQKLVKKVKGKLDLNADSFRLAIARRCTLNQLINKFGVKNNDEVTKLIAEFFPKHLLYTKVLPDGDHSYTVVPDTTNHFDWLSSNLGTSRFKFSLAPEENYLFVRFDEDVEEVRIYNLTDVHVGHKHFDEARFIADIERIRLDPNGYAVLGGDIFEWAHKNSVGDPWEQVISPMEQVAKSARLLMPIRHKILGYRSGNHDKGRGKLVGADLAEVLATILQVPYFKVETFIQLVVKNQLFTVVLDHGHSGGSLQSILRDAEKFKESTCFFAHAHMSGHVHNAQVIPRMVRNLEIGRGLIMQRTYTVIGGSYLNYTGTYAEEAKYSPTPQDLTYFWGTADGAYGAAKIEADPK